MRKPSIHGRAALVALLMIGGLPAMAEPVTEYLSDVFHERVFFFTQGWGVLGIDTCTHAPDKDPNPLRIKDTQYDKGLGHHAPGEIVVELNGEYEAFEVEIGVQWQQGTTGTVVFQAFVDGEQRFDSGVVREQDEPRPVRVDVRGADELRLVATDAGDGITCDCADWANARLVRDPAAVKRPPREWFDAAPFARVVTFDPERVDGARANRIQEFRAEDVFLAADIAPNDDGTYTVPTAADGRGCIGLQWAEHRFVRELAMEFADVARMPSADQVQAQYWAGESWWQGQWKPLEATLEQQDQRWVWQANWRDDLDTMRRGVKQVRWLFAPTGEPAAVRRLSARTHSRWGSIDLLLDLERPLAGQQGALELYNGAFLNPDGALHRTWDLSGPLRVGLRHTGPRTVKADRTLLRLRLPTGAFAIAIEDILEHGEVYVPHYRVYVTRDPADASLAEYREQIKERKTVLGRVREMPDQTFAQAMERVHNPVQDRGPTMLSLAGDNRKFVVDRDGTFGPYKGGVHPAYSFHIVPRAGSGASPWGSRHLYGGWLPVPEVTADESGVVYRERVFVAPAGERDPDASPWWHPQPLCVAEFAIENTTAAAAEASLRLDVAIDDEKLSSAELQPDETGILLRDGERLLALVDTSAAPLETRLDGRSLTLSGTLPARATATCRVYIPGWELKVGEHAPLADRAPTSQDAATYWHGILAPTMQIEIPDPLLKNLIRASQVHCLMAARNEEQGARIAPWIASDRYGPLESEGHSIVLGMDLFGHHDFARRCLDFYIRRYNETGFLTTGYTVMGTGWHLWTLADHHFLARDHDWLRANAAEIARVCEWITRQRKKTERLDLSGEKRPEHGLMPPGVVADWGAYTYRFFLEGHYCAGLQEAARALVDIGHPGGESLLADAEGFRQEVLRAYRWAQTRGPAMPLSDGTFVPAIPAMLYCFGPVGEFYPGADGNRSWAGDVEIGTHHLVALGLMDPASKDAEWMTEVLEDYWFLRSGMGDYSEEESRADWFSRGGFAKIQPYYGRLIDVHALRDDVKPFIRCYFNAIPSLLCPENLSMWEHFHNMGAWNKTHETGWLLQQTRLMFVMERGEELWLAPFVTSNWLQDGMKVSVREAPTQFGPVSYEIRSSVGEGFIEADIRPPTRSAPEAIVIRLRHPEGKPIRSLTVNGRPHEDFDAKREIVRLAGGNEPILVRAEY